MAWVSGCSMCFNGAAHSRARKCAYVAGRLDGKTSFNGAAHSRARKCQQRDQFGGQRHASMGPRTLVRGNDSNFIAKGGDYKLQWGRALSCAEMAIIGTVEFSMSCPAGRERSCKNHSAVQPWLRTLVRSTTNFQHFIPVREDTAFCTSPWRSHSLRHENRIVCDFLDRSILRASASGFPEDGGNSHDN